MTGNGSGLTGVANTDVIFTDKLQVGDSPELISVGVGKIYRYIMNQIIITLMQLTALYLLEEVI